MKLNVEQVEAAIEDAGLTPREYSGRGMYGTHCLGVDVSRSLMMGEMTAIAVNLIQNGAAAEDVKEFARGTDYDSMGLGMVLYWPSLELNDEQVDRLGGYDEEDDDEE